MQMCIAHGAVQIRVSEGLIRTPLGRIKKESSVASHLSIRRGDVWAARGRDRPRPPGRDPKIPGRPARENVLAVRGVHERCCVRCARRRRCVGHVSPSTRTLASIFFLPLALLLPRLASYLSINTPRTSRLLSFSLSPIVQPAPRHPGAEIYKYTILIGGHGCRLSHLPGGRGRH